MTRIGIIGTGGMANSHAQAYAQMKGVSIVACCDILEDRSDAFAKKWKIAAHYTDYRSMLDKEKLDGVSIVTPDAQHAAISIAALELGIPVLCEKPMASTLPEAKRMIEASRKRKVINMVNYSKRNSFGLQAARKIIASGGIGDVRHVEASYLQGWLATNVWGDWRKTPAFAWRLSKKHGSLGALGDIGCHIYDMATFLCGDIVELYCRLETYDKGVGGRTYGEYDLDANDSFVSTVRFANGALGTVHCTRWAVSFIDRPFIRVYGSTGTIEVDLNRSWDDYLISRPKSIPWKTVKGKRTLSNYERFVKAINSGVNDECDFENAFKIQAYLEYSVRSDARDAPMKLAKRSLESSKSGT